MRGEDIARREEVSSEGGRGCPNERSDSRTGTVETDNEEKSKTGAAKEMNELRRCVANREFAGQMTKGRE